MTLLSSLCPCSTGIPLFGVFLLECGKIRVCPGTQRGNSIGLKPDPHVLLQSPYWGWGLKVSKQLNVPLLYIPHCSLPQLPQRAEEQLPSETRMSLLGTPCHKPHPKLKQENSLESPSSLDPPSPQIQPAHQHRQGRLITLTNDVLSKRGSFLSSQGPWEAHKAGTTMLILHRRKRLSKVTQRQKLLNPHSLLPPHQLPFRASGDNTVKI